MFNNNDFNVTNIEKCNLVSPQSHITEKNFKVRIPRLMPKIEMAPPVEKEISTGKNLIKNKVNVKEKIESTNYIEAKSMTDYRSWMFGQIYKMSHSLGVTETEITPISGNHQTNIFEERVDKNDEPDFIFKPYEKYKIKRPISFNAASTFLKHNHLIHSTEGPHGELPHESHAHDINKPFQFFNVKFEELNNRVIKFGKELIGVFISGDLNDFRIIHIPEMIPQKGD